MAAAQNGIEIDYQPFFVDGTAIRDHPLIHEHSAIADYF
jgi:hypothetical protein